MSKRCETETLVRDFDHLNQCLKQFRTLLLQYNDKNKTQHWILSNHQSSVSLLDVADTLTNIWHLHKGDGRKTDNLYGLIGVPLELIPVIHQLNQTKTNFQNSVKIFRDQVGDPLSVLKKRSEQLNIELKNQGLARLHLKQCYRLFPVLDSTPAKVAFSWYTSGRSIKKVSVATAEKKLLKMDTSQLHIQLQLEALAKIPQTESLAQLQPQVPLMRANILWKDNEQLLRKARNAPLPIFFPLDDKENFPEYNVPSLTPPETRKRQQRSDLIIDPEPYLPSLRIHRYR
ncbi:DNA replication terminus site-binding protein [Neptuniibacter sp. 2_MG-2023]|uniref:DNA replication terminus site-binding protein n=1 Tax=Neptuniibacter sp. 2_MG-2023 TaxID=3062671 RepID=UPI0026E2439F|nr:DNA replication terminus site-binding protein [Neptuniibacter sp. 2_MG-2023]MDO6513277.1 DNA replication terminus site-binding protein [Neptuniibacter sp. 2_MG-2023]